MAIMLLRLLLLFLSCGIHTHARHVVILNVLDHGVIGDGIHDDTRAMQALVSQPHSIVVIPVHTTVKTGPLTLTSHLTLQVDGTLQALDATPSVLNTTTTTWPILPPLDLYNSSEDLGKTRQYQALLYAQNVTRVRITGTGIIDGRGELWWNAFRAKFSLLQAGRPNLVQMVHSRRVEIDSVTFRNSPFWTIHPVHCEFVYIHHVTIRARLYAPNVDGIDPDACRHVLMEYNDISCGDDHIAIKAGRCGEDGVTPNKCTNPIWSSGVYQTTNVTVRHNIFRVGMVRAEEEKNVHVVCRAVASIIHASSQLISSFFSQFTLLSRALQLEVNRVEAFATLKFTTIQWVSVHLDILPRRVAVGDRLCTLKRP